MAASASSLAGSSDDSQAELKHFYAGLERSFNSDAFLHDPSIALTYFDVPAMRLFDIMLPEEFQGEDFGKHFVAASLDYPEKVQFLEMNIHADGKLAFVSYIQRITGKKKDGPEFDVRVPTTDGLVKSAGHWHIVHEHVSLPVDDATNVALLKLLGAKPTQ
jgi:ketosteroid isomerase-like protein